MSRYIFKPVLLLCVAVFLLSCGEAMPDFPFASPLEQPRQPVSCSDILSPELTKNPLPSDQWTLEETVLWIQEAFGVDPKQDTAASAPIQYLRWEHEGKTYTMSFYKGDSEGGVSMRWQNPPTVDEFLTCMGNPTHYDAWFDLTPEGLYPILFLWYPKSGYIFDVYEYGRKRPTTITGSMLMSAMWYVSPGSIEEVVARFYSSEIGSERHKQSMTRLKVWPGSLDKIMIDKESSRNN